MYEIGSGEGTDSFREDLYGVRSVLSRRKAKFQSAKLKGLRKSLTLGLFLTRSGGLVLEPEVMKFLSELGIQLDSHLYVDESPDAIKERARIEALPKLKRKEE